MKKNGMVIFLALLFIMVLGAEDISIVGTGSGMTILSEIAEDFMLNNSGTTILVPPSIGSGGGILSVGTGQECMGRVARQIKQREEGYGLDLVEIAKIPIVFFTNKEIRIDSLTHEQVLDIFCGRVTNWSQIGGPNQRIQVVRRESGDSSLGVLESTMPGFSGDTICSGATTKYSDQDNIAFIEQTAGSIGFGTLGEGSTADVHILMLDDHAPTSSSYPYLGFLALIYHEDDLPSGAKAFLDFATSENARAAITRTYGVAVF